MRKKSGDVKLTLQGDLEGETQAVAAARTALRPTVGAAFTVRTFGLAAQGRDDVTALVAELAAQCKMVAAGDLSRAEAMLTAQAHALDAIFHSLASRAANNLGHYPQTVETYMKLALRAQSQSRATLETLAAIKNPPVVIARQANIAHGHQQVNNGPPPRADETQTTPSKLLEQTDGNRMDFGATSQASGSDPQMETLGTINGAKIG